MRINLTKKDLINAVYMNGIKNEVTKLNKFISINKNIRTQSSFHLQLSLVIQEIIDRLIINEISGDVSPTPNVA